jgi:hypothetical protein
MILTMRFSRARQECSRKNERTPHRSSDTQRVTDPAYDSQVSVEGRYHLGRFMYAAFPPKQPLTEEALSSPYVSKQQVPV